jgi:hypothetical protein
MKNPLGLLLLIPVLAAGIILLDRFFLWCERRGWIYYRKSRGMAVSAKSAMLHMQSLIEPGKTYQIEEERSEREEEDGEGAPPEGKGRMPIGRSPDRR